MQTDLAPLEERVERGLFRDWREAGDALGTIRDEALHKPEYSTFTEYVEKRYAIHRGTAYSYIWSASVMRDIEAASSRDDVLNLPQRHAALLFRFDADTRCVIAPRIARLSFRDATRWVMEYMEAVEEEEEQDRGPEHEPDLLLAALGDALQTIRHLVDETDLLGRITGLQSDARAKLDRELRAATKRLLIARETKDGGPTT